MIHSVGIIVASVCLPRVKLAVACLFSRSSMSPRPILNSSKASWIKTRLARLKILGLVCLWMLPLPLHAQSRNFYMPLRDLPQELVATPDQLLQKLSSLQGVELPKSSNQRLMELGQQMLERMSDEQKEFFQELASDLQQGREPPIPPELRDMAQELQQNMFKDESPLNMQELLREFSRQNQQPSSNEQRPRGYPGRSDNPVPRSRSDRSTRKPKFESAAPRQAQSKPRPDSDERRSQPAKSDFSKSKVEELANRISEKFQESSDKEAFNPDPSFFEQREEVSGERSESVGNRFDRMIMKAVKNQLNERSESRSELAESVEDLFSGALERVHRALNRRDWRSSESKVTSRNPSDSTNRRAKSVWSGGTDGFGGGSIEIGDTFINWLMGAMGLGLAVVLVAFGCRWWFPKQAQSAGPRRLFAKVKFRGSRVGSGTDLIQAMDQLVLDRFGLLSRW